MSIKEIVVGAVITVVIGGTAYTVNKADVAKNFANDTGLSQEQAEEYVSKVKDADLVPYDQLGTEYIEEGQKVLDGARQIDCINYEYDWQSSLVTCETGKAQLNKYGNDIILLGRAYKKLGSDSASNTDIELTITRIDELNSDYDFEIVKTMIDSATIDEARKGELYNKAVLKTVLDSNQ